MTAYSNTAKNAYLNALVKGTSNATYKLDNSLKLVDSSFNEFIITPLTWGPAIDGKIAAGGSFTPDGTWTAETAELAAAEVTGTVSETGGGGMVILTAAALVTSTPNDYQFTLSIPKNAGGTLKLNQALVTAWASAIALNSNLPALADGGVISIYTGSQPTDADTAIGAQTLLWSTTLAATAFDNAVTGTISLASSIAENAVATGTAAWFRWQKGAYVMDGTVGTTGADLTVSTTSMVNTNSHSITAFTLTFGA